MSKWKREIENHPAVITLGDDLKIENQNSENLKKWMEETAKDHELTWLLVHADDGILWGRFDESDSDRKLTTSETVASHVPAAKKSVCVPLRMETIQQARLFGKTCEVLIYRVDDNQLKYRIIEDIKDGQISDVTEAYDEPYLLWGTHGVELDNNFTLLSDGAQGLYHAVPIALKMEANDEITPPHLVVRHYLNKTGVAKVLVSRLVDLVDAPEVN
jgi:CRISPR-associated protein (TIGR03984 family)